MLPNLRHIFLSHMISCFPHGTNEFMQPSDVIFELKNYEESLHDNGFMKCSANRILYCNFSTWTDSPDQLF